MRRLIGLVVTGLILAGIGLTWQWQPHAQAALMQTPPPDQSVTIANFSFQPNTLTVPVNTLVVWTNTDGAPHTTTSSTGKWDSGALSQGQSFSHRFFTPGTYAYVCSFHASMQGTIIVTGDVTTSTPTPITGTLTPTPTPITGTLTPTPTPITGTLTPTPTPITGTLTPTPTPNLTTTATPTPDLTATPTPTPTATAGTTTPTATPASFDQHVYLPYIAR